ncbi:MAG TPA: Tm-1-like ATP-binding domain-containing protein, partial [Anaerolineales bacterium]|nr:Tm-1-like ATP-binding domain-containing protein [Anaerolineales bacterium]
MKKKTIAIVGALDTKSQEYAFLKEEIEKRGHATFVINVGVLGQPPFPPEVTAQEVALAGGAELADLIEKKDRGEAMEIMTRGAAIVSKTYFEAGKFSGMISMGGGGGTVTGTSAMRVLPVGVPKLMMSTVASGDTSAY